MKRFFAIMLSLVFILSIISSVFAANPKETTLLFKLSSDNGKDNIYVSSGDTVKVDLALENVTNIEEGYDIQSVASVIEFDKDFFEVDVENFKFEFGEIASDSAECVLRYASGNTPVVLINDWYTSSKSYGAKQHIASFDLKVKATDGDSVIRLIDKYAILGEDEYIVSAQNLTVHIGDEQTPTDEKFTLSFVTNSNSSFDPITQNSGTKLSIKSYKPSRTGYSFKGWYLEEDFKTLVEEITFDDNKTVYAKWEKSGGGGGGGTPTPPAKKYTLTFDGGEFEPITKNEGETVNLSAYKPEKDGYDFGGWYTDEALTRKVTSVKFTGDISIYAKWTKRSTSSGSVTRYILSFETNGGSKIDSVSKVRNTTVDLSKYISEKNGYSFAGWYSDKELTKLVSSVKMTSGIKLYAKWVEGESGYESNPNYKPDIFTSEHNAYIVGREGGYIDPKANLTRAEAATIFFRLLDAQVLVEGMTKDNDFSDVNKGDWFNTAVSTLTNLEVLNGRSEDIFDPNATITRAELMTIVARLSEAKYEGKDLFIDISNHWAKEYINIAASINWANGDNGMFRPDDNVTRAEAMTIVNRSLNRLPEYISDLLDDMAKFVDNSDKSAWYYLNIQEATNSHDFEFKDDGIHEKWTKLKKTPDWAGFEE